MSTFHEFECPRNLYEKLTRDNERLANDYSGDNVFSFVSTVVHIQPWIKNSPIDSTETVRRLMRKTSKHPYVKICKDITSAKSHFKLEICDKGGAILHVGDEQIDVDDFRTKLVSLFDNFFMQK